MVEGEEENDGDEEDDLDEEVIDDEEDEDDDLEGEEEEDGVDDEVRLWVININAQHCGVTCGSAFVPRSGALSGWMSPVPWQWEDLRSLALVWHCHAPSDSWHTEFSGSLLGLVHPRGSEG